MKTIEKISENKNYTAINVGNIKDIEQYSLIHPKLKTEIKGKLFLKEAIQTSGTEISFTTIHPKSEVGYFHIHNKNEEIFIILKGFGYYQADEDCFPIKEGSIIRVAPKGIRSLCNTSNENMVYICIQAKKDSLEEYTAEDGERVAHTSKWNLNNK